MNISKCLYQTKKIIIRHLPTILSIASTVCTVASVATAVKATTKAVKIIDEEKSKSEEPLTKKEVVKKVWKCYIPTAVFTMASIAGNLSSNAINIKRQTALSAGLALLQQSQNEYKKWVEEHNKELSYDEFIKEKAENEPEPEIIETYTEENILLYNPYDKNNKYLVTKLSAFKDARYEYNQLLATLGGTSLSEFFLMLDAQTISGDCYCGPSYGDFIGWCVDENININASTFVQIEASETNRIINNMPVYTLCFGIDPYEGYDLFTNSDLYYAKHSR